VKKNVFTKNYSGISEVSKVATFKIYPSKQYYNSNKIDYLTNITTDLKEKIKKY